MESDQGAKKSNSPIDFANKGIRMVQNARNAQKIASTIQKAKKIQAAVSIAASTWEVWVPVLIIIVIVVLFLVIIATIAGQGGSSTNGVSPQPGPPPPIPGQPLACDSGDYKTCLSDNFNISISGDLPSNGPQIIFGIIANAASSPTYKDLLTCGGRTISIVVTNSNGASLSYGVITLNGFFSSGYSLGGQTQLLIHELGHQIYNHNCGRIQQKYDHPALVAEDPVCYESGYLISYAYRTPYSQYASCDKTNPGRINGVGESFAETLGDYVAYKSYAGYSGFLCSVSLKNTYKSTCPKTYDWAKNNVFGGVEF